MISCKNLRFSYPGDPFELEIDRFEVRSGEAVAIVGPSGCGKTTLVNLVAGLLVPSQGSVRVGDREVSALAYPERQRFRIGTIGWVPQNFELLPYLTVRENILLPFRLGARAPEGAADRCEGLAGRSGIARHLDKYPSQLSQGERQRAALCRGLVAAPPLLIADEPTGNLDPANQDRIISLLLEESRGIGATVLMITHDRSSLSRFDRVVDILELRGVPTA